VSRGGSDWDVIVVGAGPAGASAALILGRCCRRVLICDRGTPRSWASHAMHGFLSRDGVDPALFREQVRSELARYSTVEFRQQEVLSARHNSDSSFTATLADGQQETACKLLLATGVSDELPSIPNIADFFGTSVFPCPYCDGWERRGDSVAVFGRGRRAFDMARAMTAWTRDILVCTDGPSGLSHSQRDELARNAIRVETSKITSLSGTGGQLERIHFQDGRATERHALFFDTPSRPQSNLAEELGCELTASGSIRCGQYEASSVPGVFVAGNILKDVQLSIVAAAEGARAAFGINRALTREDFTRRAGGGDVLEHPGHSAHIE
jgi:thioredoxin reductase